VAGKMPAAGYKPAPHLKLMLRRFRPPVRAQVWCSATNQPVRIVSSKGDWRVHACAGPWITSGDWWTGSWDWEEWDVEVVSSGVYRIHQDRRVREWSVDGEYD